jgi:hypothetical protein
MTNIRKTLEGLLLTCDGKLYLGELVENIAVKTEKEMMAK